jgi:murein DD-endopeptidase MepM/ murein hydrolase activator NlpD
MSRLRRPHIVGLLVLLSVPLTWLLWQARPGAADRQQTGPAASPVSMAAAATLSPIELPTASNPAPATSTTGPPPTLTLVPSITASSPPTIAPPSKATPTSPPAAVATATAWPTADPVDRTCPDPPPAKPNYDRYFLSPQSWPTPDPALGSHFWLSRPLPGAGRLLVTEWLPYGYDANGRYLLHNGIDTAPPIGTPVLAAADGTVVVAGEDMALLYGWRCNWYGHLVVVELDDRWLDQPVYLLYGHVLNIVVESGQRVSRGEQLAEVGFGGAAVNPHLHLEVRVGSNEFGATRNPLLWLAPPPSRGILAGRLVDPEGRPWQGVVVTVIRQDDGQMITTWTYLGDPDHLINPDEGLAENFIFGDLEPGPYEVRVVLQDVTYKEFVEIEGGQLTAVELVTEPLKTPEPSPADPSPTPEPASSD